MPSAHAAEAAIYMALYGAAILLICFIASMAVLAFVISHRTTSPGRR